MRTYEDFHLWISAQGEGGDYLVRAWEAGESQSFTLDAAALGEKARRLGEAFEGRDSLDAASLREAKVLGSALFDAIFPRSIFTKWKEARRGIAKRDLRLRLHFERAGDLVPIPWELLHDGRRFLCLYAETPIVHDPEFSGPEEFCTVKSPLRLLAVLPEPLRQPDLDAHGEFLEIQEELAPAILNGAIVLEALARPTFRGLLERLKADPPVHALHFAGHGEALPAFGDGRLWFQQDGRIRNADPIPGYALAPLLSDAGVRFVFINACEGGRSASSEDPGNLAHRLLEAGVPAVLALRTSIGNRAAKEFSRTFYHLLAATGSLEEAVAAGRQALQKGAFGLSWASPVLYLRAPTGQLIDCGETVCPDLPAKDSLQEPERRKNRRRWILAALGFTGIFGLAFAAYLGRRIYEEKTLPGPPLSSPLCPSPPGLDFAFQLVPSGGFYMGAPEGRGDPTEERPSHRVDLTAPFCVAAFEVTSAQRNAIATGGNAETRPQKDSPEIKISWNEIESLLEKLNDRDPGARYRLLTEAEWEYAARAGGVAAFGFGENPKDLKANGNCLGAEDGFAKVAPIGSYPPNRLGLYDLHGNVQEWVAGWFGLYPSNRAHEVDPQGPEEGTEKVRRGGSFNTNASTCAAWSRGHSKPDHRQNDLGFRIARSPVVQGSPRESEPGSPKKLP